MWMKLTFYASSYLDAFIYVFKFVVLMKVT